MSLTKADVAALRKCVEVLRARPYIPPGLSPAEEQVARSTLLRHAPALVDMAEEVFRWREDAACPSCGGVDFRPPGGPDYVCMNRWHYLNASEEAERLLAENVRLKAWIEAMKSMLMEAFRKVESE